LFAVGRVLNPCKSQGERFSHNANEFDSLRTGVELEAGAPENRQDKFRAAASTTPNLFKSNRILNITVQVLKRDGYQCVVTGLRDKSHPLFPPSQNPVKTKASHIFRRAIAVYDGDDPENKTVRLPVASSG
jgi:hypothetical protein